MNAGYFRLERQKEGPWVIHLVRDGSQTLKVMRFVGRRQLWNALGYLPSDTPNRLNVARDRLRKAGVLE